MPVVIELGRRCDQLAILFYFQDTVIALQALARYSALAYSPNMHLSVLVTAPGMTRRFTINDDNKMLMQKSAISMPSQYGLRVNGTGCAFVQVSGGITHAEN